MIRYALGIAAMAAFFLTFAGTTLLLPVLTRICFLHPRKFIDGKQGKPTMGGLCVLLGFGLGVQLAMLGVKMMEPALAVGTVHKQFSLVLCCVIAFGILGLVNDVFRLRFGRDVPLWVRLAVQAALAVLFVIGLEWCGALRTTAALPVLGVVKLGLWHYPLAVAAFWAACASHEVMDDAEGSVLFNAFVAMLCLLVVCVLTDHFQLSLVPSALAGALLAFSLWNFVPAKLLLGNVGSQMLAAATVALCCCVGQPGLAWLLCGMPLVEGLSLWLQKLSLRVRKKPLLPYAPLHTALQKAGNTDTKVTLALCGGSLSFAVMAAVFLRLYLQ